MQDDRATQDPLLIPVRETSNSISARLVVVIEHDHRQRCFEACARKRTAAQRT